MQQTERSQSESYFWPIVWAVGLHVLMFAMLFVSFAFTPELPPARPVVQATLYQLQSQSQATTRPRRRLRVRRRRLRHRSSKPSGWSRRRPRSKRWRLPRPRNKARRGSSKSRSSQG